MDKRTRKALAKKFPEEMKRSFLCTSGDEEKLALLQFRDKNEIPEPSPKERVQTDIQMRTLEQKNKKLSKHNRDLVDQFREMQEQMDVMSMLPKPQRVKTGIKSRHGAGVDEAVAVFVTSDWHIEEQVDPSTISGMNEYTPEIAGKRLTKMWESALRCVDKERSISKIDTMVCAVIGDLITGFIHDELVESNWLHPLEALELAQNHLIDGLSFLADHGKFKEIVVPCCFGNHGRTTTKRRVSTAAKNNYEWFMYRQVAKYFEGDKRFRFLLTDGYFITEDIMDTRVRFHHGDNVRYYGGVGGLTIPLNKSIQQWNKNNPRPADYDVLGHYHQLQFTPDAMINGSVVGYNPYALSIKARYEPPQQGLFLVAKDHGPTCFNRVWVE